VEKVIFKRDLLTCDLMVLDFLEKHPRGVSIRTIEREIDIVGTTFPSVLSKLCRHGFISKKFRLRKQKHKRTKKRLIYALNPLLRSYLRYYLDCTQYLPFIERSSTQWIYEKRWAEVPPEIKLRTAYKAIRLLEEKRRLLVKKIPAVDSTSGRETAYLVARTSRVTDKLNSEVITKKKVILESRNNFQVDAFAKTKRGKVTGYYYFTKWGFYSYIDTQFCHFLSYIIKTHFDSKNKVKVEDLRQEISTICGIDYSFEPIVIACYLSNDDAKPLNADVNFSGHITIKAPEIEKQPTALPKPLVLLARPRECHHKFTQEYVSIGGEIKAVKKICIMCDYTVQEKV
jgi:DNA-binding PadR family transcriptional regulator